MNAKFDLPQHRLLNQALNCLSRFGETLSILCLHPGEKEHVMRFSSMSPSQSAFGAFLFNQDFFDSYAIQNERRRFDIQLPIRNLQSILRSFHNRHLQSCEMEITEHRTECRLSIRLYGAQGTSRTHKLTYEAAPCLFPREQPSIVNHIVASPKTIQALLDFFATKVTGDITMMCTIRGCSLSSRTDETLDVRQRQPLHTEVRIEKESFIAYKVGQEAEMTFSLREFRAAVALADHLQSPLEMHFEKAGYPLNLLVRSEGMTAQIFLATSEPDVPRLLLRDQSITSESNQTGQPVRMDESNTRDHAVEPNTLANNSELSLPIPYNLGHQNNITRVEEASREPQSGVSGLFRQMDGEEQSEQGSQNAFIPRIPTLDEFLGDNHELHPLESTPIPPPIEEEMTTVSQGPATETDTRMEQTTTRPSRTTSQPSHQLDSVLTTFEEECARDAEFDAIPGMTNNYLDNDDSGASETYTESDEGEVPTTQRDTSTKRPRYNPLF